MSAQDRRASRAHLHPSPDSGFLSRQQVSEIFGFSVSYLAQLPRTELWYHKVGNKVFYEHQHVVAYIRGNREPASAVLSAPKSPASRGRPRKPALKSAANATTAASTV